MSRKLCVGLTGGIGSGKTTVSNLFKGLGATVIDADTISRDLTAAGSPATKAIVEAFGKAVLDKNGILKRDYVRNLVFNDAKLRQSLESIIHPLVAAEIERISAEISAPYYIVSVPLLIENDSDYNIDRILVVDASEELQVARASARDAVAPAEIRKIIRVQTPRQRRLDAADDVITNDADLVSLSDTVKVLHDKYMSLADSR